MNRETIQLQFYYPTEGFAKNFLSWEDDMILNTSIDREGDMLVVYIDINNHLYNSVYVDHWLILDDLALHHQEMRDEDYDYRLAYSYVEMQSAQCNYEEDLVFIRVEKTKKEGM